MKKLLFFGFWGLLLLPLPAQAQQQYLVVAACGAQTYPVAQRGIPLMDVTGNICTNATGGGGGGAITNPLGHATVDTAAVAVVPSATAVFPVSGIFWQATQPVSGTVAANAGTNLNTSALALETGGNLDSISGVLGTPTDAACAAYNTSPCTLEQLLRLLTKVAGNTANIQGDSASGAALTENPLADGGRAATTNPTAVTDGQKVALMASKTGKLVELPYSVPDLVSTGGGSKTDNTALTLLGASGSSSLKEYLVSVHCGRSDAGTAAITVAISEGTKTRTLVIPNNGGGGGNNVKYDPPEAFAANTAVTATASTGVTTLYCDAQGFNAP